jgi:hypothetical protein
MLSNTVLGQAVAVVIVVGPVLALFTIVLENILFPKLRSRILSFGNRARSVVSSPALREGWMRRCGWGALFPRAYIGNPPYNYERFRKDTLEGTPVEEILERCQGQVPQDQSCAHRVLRYAADKEGRRAVRCTRCGVLRGPEVFPGGYLSDLAAHKKLADIQARLDMATWERMHRTEPPRPL